MLVLFAAANPGSGSQGPNTASSPSPQQQQPPPATHASDTSTSTSATTTSNTADFPEHVVLRLMGYGFPRELVIQELRSANGNVDQALAALFAKSLNIP